MQRRFAFHTEQDRRALLSNGGFVGAEVVQGEGKIVNRNREIQLCAVFHWLSKQLRSRFRHELHVGNQFRDVDVFWRQARAQHIIGVSHYLQRHAVQVGVWRFSKQEHRFARVELHHVQQQRREKAAVVRVKLGNHANGIPWFTFLAAQRGFQHRQRVGFFFALHIQQAGKQLAQRFCGRVLQEVGDSIVRPGDRLQQGDDVGKFAEGVHRQERGKGENQFRLVVRIFVVTLCGV